MKWKTLVLILAALAATRLDALPYTPNQVEIPGAVNQGLSLGNLSLGDYDNDGDLDILISGQDAATNPQLRLYRNDAGSTVWTLVNVTPANGGLDDSTGVFGDMDGDGDLDILVSGREVGNTGRIRIYRNDGGGVFTALADIANLGGGANRMDVALGDFDNDGDLDFLWVGRNAGVRSIRVFRNFGNMTFDTIATAINPGTGVDLGDVAWGDLDNDGDLDIVYTGQTGNTTNTAIFRRVPNNGNGTFGAAVDVVNAATGFGTGEVRLGDYNNDGWLDIIAAGIDRATGARQWRAFRSNANPPALTFTQVEIPGAGAGYRNSAGVFGDVNNDGILDAAIAGRNAANQREIRVSTYNAGTNVWTTPVVNPESAANLGLQDGGVALGDVDNDGDLDLLASGANSAGNRQLRLYRSSAALTLANAVPTAPTTLAGRFAFDPNGVSVASFTWNAGTDGAYSANSLSYDLQVSTLAVFSRLTVPGLLTTPQMGNYLRPTNIFGAPTPYGVTLRSTQPWAVNTAHPGLLTDTTYYFRVRTIDAGLRPSAPSATQTLWTGVAPATSTLVAATGFLPGDISLSWASAGDDLMRANLTGNYRVQYATTAGTAWSPTATPSGAFTLTLATANVVPGTAQAVTVNVPTNDTWYFVLWSQDDVGLWSAISNTANAVPALINRSVTIDSGAPYDFGNQTVGTSSASATAVVIRNDGNVVNTYSLSAATTTVGGSPWVLGSAAGPDVLAVFAGFHPTRPAAAAFGLEDVMGGTPAAATAAVFSIDGSETGAAVSVGASRSLWLRLDTPTLSSTEAPQQVTVTITAGP